MLDNSDPNKAKALEAIEYELWKFYCKLDAGFLIHLCALLIHEHEYHNWYQMKNEISRNFKKGK